MKYSLWMMVCGVLFGVSASAPAAKIVGHLTIDPAGVARINSPIAATVEGELPAGDIAVIPSGPHSGPAHPVSVERSGKTTTLRWIERHVDGDKPQSYDLLLLDNDRPMEPAFHFAPGEGTRDLLYGDKAIWRDMLKYAPADRANTFKPYKHVFGFNDDGLITKGPGGLYTHHRGIFF